jgi:hypothetical protein
MEGRRHARQAHQEVVAVARAKTATHAHLRRRLAIIFTATALMAIISTLVVYFTEHNAKGTEIHDLFDAFIFSASQLLTASSVASPATDFGKLLELVFDLWALTVVATLAGSFGAFFHARSKEIDAFEHRMLGEAGKIEHRMEAKPEAP